MRRVDNGAVKHDAAGSYEINELAEQVLTQADGLLGGITLSPRGTDAMLTSHVRAMAHRSIPASLYRKSMPACLMKSQPNQWRSPAKCGGVWQPSDEEARLLSVHFEVAKDNLYDKNGTDYRRDWRSPGKGQKVAAGVEKRAVARLPYRASRQT